LLGFFFGIEIDSLIAAGDAVFLSTSTASNKCYP